VLIGFESIKRGMIDGRHRASFGVEARDWEKVGEITMNTMKGNLFFEDKTYSFETIRMLSHVYLRSSDFGEVISTVKRIDEGNGKSWFDNWTATAAHLEAIGDGFLKSGHSLSARDTLIRAANYYRQADFFIHDSAANLQLTIDSSNRAVRCFQKAMPYFPGTLDFLEVPYEDITLPSYFWRAAKPEKPAPTLIVHSGFDGTAEEVLLWFGWPGIERGYNIIAFEGPGQGSVLRNKKKIFRHDWEQVVTPVIDYYLTHHADQVDAARIALLGHSIGGYLAPRAAAFEPRISACIANDGVFNLNEALRRMFDWTETDKDAWDRVAYEKCKGDQALRWWIIDGMWKFGADRPSDILTATRGYRLDSCVKAIKCHVLVMKAEKDHMFPGQPDQLFEELICPKDLLELNDDYGAGEHTHVGAVGLSNSYIYNWLDALFKAQ
jgi:pimeloyl-ACP methyl ester carboxylesterase